MINALTGVGIGIAACWSYYRITAFMARNAFRKDTFRSELLGKLTYTDLVHVQESLDREFTLRRGGDD